MLERAGYANLVNLHGGMLGATDEAGRITEPGWVACGHPQTKESEAERTWKALSKA